MMRGLVLMVVAAAVLWSAGAGAAGRMPFDMVPRNPPSPMRSVEEIRREVERNAPPTRKSKKGKKAKKGAGKKKVPGRKTAKVGGDAKGSGKAEAPGRKSAVKR